MNPLLIPELRYEIFTYLPGETLLFILPLVCKEIHLTIKALPEAFWRRKIRQEIPISSCRHLFDEEWRSNFAERAKPSGDHSLYNIRKNPTVPSFRRAYYNFVGVRCELIKVLKAFEISPPADPAWVFEVPDFSEFLEKRWMELPEWMKENGSQDAILGQMEMDLSELPSTEEEEEEEARMNLIEGLREDISAWTKFVREHFGSSYLVMPYHFAVGTYLLPQTFRLMGKESDPEPGIDLLGDDMKISEGAIENVAKRTGVSISYYYVNLNPYVNDQDTLFEVEVSPGFWGSSSASDACYGDAIRSTLLAPHIPEFLKAASKYSEGDPFATYHLEAALLTPPLELATVLPKVAGMGDQARGTFLALFHLLGFSFIDEKQARKLFETIKKVILDRIEATADEGEKSDLQLYLKILYLSRANAFECPLPRKQPSEVDEDYFKRGIAKFSQDLPPFLQEAVDEFLRIPANITLLRLDGPGFGNLEHSPPFHQEINEQQGGGPEEE